jgi:hypothetical protein
MNKNEILKKLDTLNILLLLIEIAILMVGTAIVYAILLR